MKAILVSAADAGYFALLSDLIDSFERALPGDRPDVGVLDLGLEAGQRQALTARGARLVLPEWPADQPRRGEGPPTFLAQVARPYLPDYFPGYDLILWIDADAWLQGSETIRWLAASAREGSLAVTLELHPAYWKHYLHHGIMAKRPFVERFFGAAEAELLGHTPALNAGVFALAADAPHWAEWRAVMRRVLRQEAVFCAEQLALDMLAMRRDLPVTWMPARANWLCHQALPRYCPARRLLVEPTPPFDPIWTVHLAMTTKGMAFDLQRLDGGTLSSGLRFSDLRPLLDAPA